MSSPSRGEDRLCLFSQERLRLSSRFSLGGRKIAHLETTTGTQPSGCRVVSIAPCCSVNAAFLFAEPRLVVVSRCAHNGLAQWKVNAAAHVPRRKKTLHCYACISHHLLRWPTVCRQGAAAP